MTAEPMLSSGNDPEQILRLLPADWHDQFINEYRCALDAAHEITRVRQLRDLLHLWRLRAVAYSNPTFDSAYRAASEKRMEDFVPAEQIIPGWADRW
jgi:uncharacterized protein DUF6247